MTGGLPRGNHDVVGDHLLAQLVLLQAAGVAINSLEQMHCRQKRRRKITQKIFQNLPVVSTLSDLSDGSRSSLFPPRDCSSFFRPNPKIRLKTTDEAWSVDGHLSPLHLLTVSFVAADIVTRFLSPGLVRAAQAHHRILGHERSLTQIKFNKEGDLLFSCSKDHVINVWFSHNGERLGTYDGHNGTVWTIDVDCTFVRPCSICPHEHDSRPHQHNPGFSYLVLPITLLDCGLSSQENACTSGNFPQR